MSMYNNRDHVPRRAAVIAAANLTNGFSSHSSPSSPDVMYVEKTTDSLQKQQLNVLLKTFAEEKLTKALEKEILNREQRLTSVYVAVRCGENVLQPKIRKEITDQLKSCKCTEIGIILKQLLVSKERYVPRTLNSPGTSLSLIDAHNNFAHFLVTFTYRSWICHQALQSGPHRDDYFSNVVQPIFVDLHRLLKFVPSPVQLEILRLLVEWYNAYPMDMFGMDTFREGIQYLVDYFLKCDDIVQQLYLSVLIAFLRKKDRILVMTFAYKCGFRYRLDEFCRIFDDCTPSFNPFPSFAYKAASLFNSNKGIHRTVFSFPICAPCEGFILDNEDSEYVSIKNPFDTLTSVIPWSVHFSLGSQSVCFEMQKADKGRFFVRIPFADIFLVEVLHGESDDKIILKLSMMGRLHTYFENVSIDTQLFGLEHCDSLQFTLTIPMHQLSEIAILEEAMVKSFGSRLSSSSPDFKGEWNLLYNNPEESFNPFDRRQMRKKKEFPNLFERDRAKEEEHFRELMADFDLLGHTTLYQSSEPASSKSNVQNGDADSTMQIALDNLAHSFSDQTLINGNHSTTKTIREPSPEIEAPTRYINRPVTNISDGDSSSTSDMVRVKVDETPVSSSSTTDTLRYAVNGLALMQNSHRVSLQGDDGKEFSVNLVPAGTDKFLADTEAMVKVKEEKKSDADKRKKRAPSKSSRDPSVEQMPASTSAVKEEKVAVNGTAPTQSKRTRTMRPASKETITIDDD